MRVELDDAGWESYDAWRRWKAIGRIPDDEMAEQIAVECEAAMEYVNRKRSRDDLFTVVSMATLEMSKWTKKS